MSLVESLSYCGIERDGLVARFEEFRRRMGIKESLRSN